MAITLREAYDELNIDAGAEAPVEVALYVAAANEWIAKKVTDPTAAASAPVKVATLMLLDHLWQSQRGPSGVAMPGEEMVEVRGVGFAIPNRVLELIEPYMVRVRPSGSFPDATCWPDPVERVRW